VGVVDKQPKLSLTSSTLNESERPNFQRLLSQERQASAGNIFNNSTIMNPFNYLTSSALSMTSGSNSSLTNNNNNTTGQMGTVFLKNINSCDFDIVMNILRTLRIKQIYLYQLANTRKSQGHNQNQKQQIINESKQMIQYPLFVEYEEIFTFSNKSKYF
jgi:hypothetical protein